MATTRFWKIEGTGKNLSNVINYVNNPEKVEPGECLELNLLHLLDYATNEEKTEKSAYVTGINCSVQNSFNEFMTVKEQFGKTGGILAYHGYMSFAEGEVTPDEAHKIGVEFAEKNFPGFQQRILIPTTCTITLLSIPYLLKTGKEYMMKCHGLSSTSSPTGYVPNIKSR